jgi:transposase-like protein
VPLPRTVLLTDDTRERLESLTRAGSTPQAFVFRCRLILRAAHPDDPSNVQIAAELDCDRHTVGQWRNRFLEHGLAGLQDAPRSGRPRSFSPLRTG